MKPVRENHNEDDVAISECNIHDIKAFVITIVISDVVCFVTVSTLIYR